MLLTDYSVANNAVAENVNGCASPAAVETKTGVYVVVSAVVSATLTEHC